VIFSQTGTKEDLHFHTLSGELVVAKEADGLLRMDFPKGKPEAATLPTETKIELLTLLGLELNEALVTDVQFCSTTRKLFFELSHSDLVFNSTTPDPDKLMAVKFPSGMDVRGVAIVSRTMVPRDGHPDLPSCDIASRYFSPWNGLTEDAVNGSSHTALGVMYSRKFAKQNLKCYAASSRSGLMWLDVPQDSARLFIKGYAASVLEGKLSAPQR
jgi:predicted PhzF superfamily epimerase YddE/YHI9